MRRANDHHHLIIIITIIIIRSHCGSRLRKDTYYWKCLATMAAQNAAAEPTMSPLAYLTSQSAAFGLWEVLIFAPDAQEREYIYEKKKRTAYNFRCLLVPTKEPT